MAARVAAGAAMALTAGLRRTLDIALPPLCPVCRQVVGGGAAPSPAGGLCGGCWARLSFIAPPYCERLGIPFPYDPGPGVLSMEAIADPPVYRRARGALRYDDVAGTLIHGLKYGDRTELAPMLGGWMAAAGRDLLAEADALVPVPLHWRRLWARRFNQSAALAATVSRHSGVACLPGVLARVKPTQQQVGLTRSERARNVQGAFQVPETARSAVAGRRLILVDDVLTSGATAEACARALLRAKAAHVDVLVLARVVSPARIPI